MSQNSIFNTGALVDVGKSNLFDLSMENLFTADIGKLYPVYTKFLNPADKINISVASIVKSFPTLAPYYGVLDCEVHAFVVPLRLLWRYFPKWVYKPDLNDHMPPSISLKLLSEYSGTELADFLNVAPFSASNLTEEDLTKRVNVFKPLAYHLIYNDYFRNEQLQQDLTDEDEDPTIAFLNDNELEDYDTILSSSFWELHYVNWRRDYFTSCLPNAVAGIEPTLQLFGQGATAPVRVSLDQLLYTPASVDGDFSTPPITNLGVRDNEPPHFKTQPWKTLVALGFDPAQSTDGGLRAVATSVSDDQAFKWDHDALDPDFDPSHYGPNFNYANPIMSAGHQGHPYDANLNFVTQLQNVNSEVTANSLRTLFAVEKWLEINNVTGNRYIEGTLAYYGVKVPDYRAQRPEYLGKTTFSVNVSEVVQQSESAQTRQGTRTGLANSVGASRSFKYYAFEHSIIMLTFNLRPKAYYFQGMAKDWFIMDQFDFPYRLFQHLGEQEVKDYELFVPSSPPAGFFDQTFGYQSRYAEWRSSFNEVHGSFKNNLDYWHMGRKFFDSDVPHLSDQFVRCSPDSGDFNRVFPVVGSDPKDAHFLCSIFFKVRQVRRLAYHSKPFLIS